MRKLLLLIPFLGITALTVIFIIKDTTYTPSDLDQLKIRYQKKHTPSVDHSKFLSLQKNFVSPQEVTVACITCHTERHKEVMNSSHWNWERAEYIPGKGIAYLGKKSTMNNYCIGTQGNEKSCAKCHIGFGMSEDSFSFTDSTNIDCMVCHDNSGSYVKASNLSGYPDPATNLKEIAQHIGRPTRDNCGVCHFFGGGGNNVKHGDLDKAMFTPDRSLDVHMGENSSNLVCVDCHTAENHQMKGKVYSLSSLSIDRSTCEQCHSETPHESGILNEHTLKVACQTCHIPLYAKANATKMAWDWSTAGKLDANGEPYTVEDADGNHTYMSIKGSFTWAKNIKPDYIWFNGTADHYLLGDSIDDPTQPLTLNPLNGSYDDRESKIIPVKIHKAKQIYDPVTMLLIQPKLFADKKGEGAYWVDFDWAKASAIGMKDVGLPFSGKYEFLDTKMYWPVNHQVAPKELSVQCVECHTRENSRLAGLTDFYLPGRDYSPLVDILGKIMIILSLIGIALHASLRVAAVRKNRKGGNA